MRWEQVAVDLWMAAVVASLVGIVIFFAVGVLVSLGAVVTAWHHARRPPAGLAELSRWCSVSELDEIDQALDRMLAQEHGVFPGQKVG